MTSPRKRKGDRAEIEAATLIADLTGYPVPLTCPQCGGEVPPKAQSGGPPKKFCSKACGEAFRQGRRYDKPCELCGKPKGRGKRRFCEDCQQELPERVRNRDRSRPRSSGLTRSKARIKYVEQTSGPKVRTDGKIRCAGCREYLSPRKYSMPKNGRAPVRCRKCLSAYSHSKRIERVYGITIDAYNILLDYQGGACYICRSVPKSKRLAVDHDHTTGMVRGLLCRRCNREILGYFAQNRIDVFVRAIEYLTDPPLQRITRGDVRIVEDVEEPALPFPYTGPTFVRPSDG